MRMHNRTSTVVPRGEPDTTAPAVVVDILESAYQEGNASEAEAGADNSSPAPGNVSMNIDRVKHNLEVWVRRCIEREYQDTHMVVLPDTNCVLVTALVRQDGQSTGADPSPRLWSGVEVWY